MRFTSAFVLSLSFVLANACPAEKYDQVVLFQSWNTECGDDSGHTWGMSIIERKFSNLCFPLPDNTRGLDVSELSDDCRGMCPLSLALDFKMNLVIGISSSQGGANASLLTVTAYKGPTCDDYPYEGAYREKLGCLWAGNTEFRSYKVTCKNGITQ